MKKCDICKNYSTTKGITLFRFPKNAIQQAKWVDFVNKPNWQPNTSSYLCCAQFNKSDICRRSERVRLKPNVVPSGTV